MIRSNKFLMEFSSKLLTELFNDNVKKIRINGLDYTDTLSCFLSVFEHELTHLVNFISGIKDAHVPDFRILTFNLFGHRDYRHQILHGDIDKYMEVKASHEKNAKAMKKKLKHGTEVILKNGKIAVVLESGPKKFHFCYLDDSKKILIAHYTFIDKVTDVINHKIYNEYVDEKNKTLVLEKADIIKLKNGHLGVVYDYNNDSIVFIDQKTLKAYRTKKMFVEAVGLGKDKMTFDLYYANNIDNKKKREEDIENIKKTNQIRKRN